MSEANVGWKERSILQVMRSAVQCCVASTTAARLIGLSQMLSGQGVDPASLLRRGEGVVMAV